MDPRVVAPNRQDAYRGRYADSIQEDLLAIPSLSLVMDPEDWFGGQGIYANSYRTLQRMGCMGAPFLWNG